MRHDYLLTSIMLTFDSLLLHSLASYSTRIGSLVMSVKYRRMVTACVVHSFIVPFSLVFPVEVDSRLGESGLDPLVTLFPHLLLLHCRGLSSSIENYNLFRRQREYVSISVLDFDSPQVASTRYSMTSNFLRPPPARKRGTRRHALKCSSLEA